MSKWYSTNDHTPPEGVMLETKIEDSGGTRNEQRLARFGNLWYTDLKRSMYVYYTPTHYRI